MPTANGNKKHVKRHCRGKTNKLLDRRRTQPGQGTEDSALDLRHLSVLHRVDEGVLRLCRVVLQLLGRVLLAKRRDLVEIHLQIVPAC